MAESKSIQNKDDKKNKPLENSNDLFKKAPEADEIDSDGSASAFDETERVSEDNFDETSANS